MKKLLLLLSIAIFLGGFFSAEAQVGIGTESPNPSAQLEIKSSDRGILIPKVPLTDAVDQSTITNGNVEGLMVYNTTENSKITPGFYYWYDGRWRRLLSQNLSLPDNIVVWDIDNHQFTYIDENGDSHNVDLNQLDTTNVSFTLEGDFLTVKDSNGDTVQLSVDEIARNATFVNELTTNQDFIDQVIDLIKDNETITILTDNGDGTYTYTSEDGTTTLIDIPAGIINNFDSIVQGDQVTVDGTTYTNIEEYITHLTGSTTNTTLIDNGDGTFTYTNEEGDTVTFDANTTDLVDNGDGSYTLTNKDGDSITIDVVGDIVENIQNQGDVYDEIIDLINNNLNETNTTLVDNGDGTFTYTNEEGDTVTFDASTTDLVDNGDGSYTLTNKDGDSITIDVVGDIVENIQNQGDVYDEIIDLINNNLNETNTTLVNNGDGTFTYTNEEGDTVTFDANTTDLVDNGDGSYTLTNKDGDSITIDVVGDIVENIQNQGDVYDEIVNLIDTNETLTTLVDNNDGTYTYTSEDGTITVIDVPESIVKNFEEIVKDGPVTVDGDTYNTIEEYIEHLADAGIEIEGSDYIDVSGSGTDSDPYVVEIKEGDPDSMLITNDQGELEWASIDDIVAANETITTLVDNNDGTYTYTSEDGTTTVIDVPESIINNFEEIVKDGPVTVDGDTYNTIEEYIEHLQSNGVTIEKNTEVNYTGDVIDGLPVVAFEGETHIGDNTAATSGVDLAAYLPSGASLEGVVTIKLYQNGSLITSTTTDVVINGAQIDFNIGVGNFYQVLPEGDYEVIVYATLDQ